MASITRSGRVLKHEGTSGTKSGCSSPKVTKKDSPHPGSNATGMKTRIANGTTKDAKSSTPFGTAATDSVDLRKSSRESSTKKKKMPISTSKKSEKLDEMVECLEKKRQHSPLRRSERIEKNGVSASPGLKKQYESASPPGKKKKLDEVNGKIAVTSTENKSKDKKLEIKSTVTNPENNCKDKKLNIKSYGRLKKKTIMNARRYRALLQSKHDESSDDDDILLQDGSVSKENSSGSASSSSEKVHAGLAESGGRKDDITYVKRFADNSNEAVNGSCSGSKEHAALTMDSDIERKSACLSAKEKLENKSLVSKCSGEIGGIAKTHDTQKLDKQHLEVSELVVSASDCQSLTVDITGNKNICNPVVPKAGVTSSMPCGTTSKDVKRCKECNKFEWIHNVSDALELCSCNAQREHDLIPSEDRRTYQGSDDIGSADEALKVVAGETDSGTDLCIVCKHPGQLLCCYGKGCKRSYHLSCVSPPLLHVPLGIWLCHFCVKKKVVSGVYSVSEGIESVWDVKEGLEKEKHYLVQYKGLAHVHNQWVPESQIILEAPTLVTKFDRRHLKEKERKWIQEWTEPHRLLLKRQLMPKDRADELFLGHDDKISCCYHEWLVKWKGLGYEHATWELENSPFLSSSEAAVLISDFESRREKAKRSSDSALQVKKSSFHRLKKLPHDCPAGLDNDHLNSVNRLRECWHKSQNAVFIGDQGRIIKSILFMSSLKSHTSQPFLVISTIHSLSLWETEFIRLAGSINVVVYTGTKDVRKLIRTVEFYEESGCVLFQVLLSHPDAVIEDFDALKCIGWEALIIDECQNPRVSKHLEHFKTLATEFRLLLLSGQLKDNVAEYLKLLSFLESGEKGGCFGGSQSDTNDTASSLSTMKEKLTHFLVAYERKPDPSKFLEFWVPVRLSNVQLEQYCSTLVSNSITLHSCLKVDHVGALRDLIISTRKCCDHPYLVDGSLQSFLTKDLPSDKYLDIGVKASGKLHLLDKFLHEINKQGLRVLILFQSIGGAGRDSIGDILDDFLRQRFGPDSFERVDSGLIMSKKIAALTKFNDKRNGRFVFLIENRACLPSIKLYSVDTVVIFNSDWNPLNDLRALQKIRIESQFDCVKVFRLYSLCTVEEKVLIFAKQDMILDSNVQHISPCNSHLLLSWGAFHLFNELDEFHQCDKAHDDNEISIDERILNDSMLKFLNGVVVELEKELLGIAQNNTCEGLLLIKARQNGSSYSRNITLVGERDGISSLDKDPPSFWSKLLEKKYPKWRFISEPSQRIRRKVQLFEASGKLPEVGNDEMRKKRRKLTSNTVDPISLQTWLEDKTKELSEHALVPDDISTCSFCQPETALAAFISNNLKEPACGKPNDIKCAETYGSQASAGPKCMPSSVGITNHMTCNLQEVSTSDDSAELHNEADGKRGAQRTLHLYLKPELSELCVTLKLPDDVKLLAYKLLEYIMNNHHVNRDHETILQAFKLSLCWRAASFLKHKVDHKECLALAKKYLNYTCNEEEAGSVYSKLRMLKKIFSQTVALTCQDESNSFENQPSTSIKADVAQPLHGGSSEAASSFGHHSDQIKTDPDDHRTPVQPVLEQEQAPVRQPATEVQDNLGSLKGVLLKKRIDLINIISSNRDASLLEKQQKELLDFNTQIEKEKMRLKSAHLAQLELIHSVHTDYRIRNGKIKLLCQDFSKKMVEFDQHMMFQSRKLATMQEDSKRKERNIRDCWLEEAKAGTLAESFDKLPLTETGFALEEFNEISKKIESYDGSRQSASDLVHSDLIATVSGVFAETTEKHLDIPTTIFNCRLENVQTLASNSTNVTEAEPLQADGLSSRVLETTLVNNNIEVEPIERNETQSTVLGLDSDLMCTDMNATVPGISTGTTENNLEKASTFPIGGAKDAESLASHPTAVAEAEPTQPNGTSTELLKTVPTSMVDMESIEPIETQKEIAETVLPAADGGILRNGGPAFSKSEVMNLIGGDPQATHVGPLQTNLTAAEVLENVSSNMVEVESIEPEEMSTEIPTAALPSEDANTNKDGETPFSELDVDAVGNQLEMHVAPSVVTTSLPKEIETIAFQSNNMVQVEAVDSNGTSSLPLEGHASMENEPSLSQMNTEDNGSVAIGIDSTVETTTATSDGDLHEGENNADGMQLRSSPQQDSADLLSISHVLTNTCGEKSVSEPDQILQLYERERPAVSVETECGEGFNSICTMSPVPVVNVVTLQIEPTAHHVHTSNSTLLQVPQVDNFPADNQSSTSRPIRSEGENHTVGTHSSPLMHAIELQAEEFNRLATQSVLHPSPPAGTVRIGEVQPHGICGKYSQGEVPASHPVVTSPVLANQSNELVSQPVLHSSVLPTNLLTDQSRTATNLLTDQSRMEGIDSSGALQGLGTRLLQILPMAACVHPQALHPDPLQNELTRIQKQVELRTKMHEEKKLQRKLECEAEIEKVRKKYEALLQEDEFGFHQDKKILDTIYNKVLVNQILAEEFRSKFIDGKGPTSSSNQGRSAASMPQLLQTPHVHVAPRPSTSFVPNLANRPPIASPQAQVPSGPSVPPGLVVRSTPSVIPPNTHVRSQFSPRSNLQGANDARIPSPRAPAPHLHRFRPLTSSMMTPPILPPRPRPVSAPQIPLSNLSGIPSRAPLSTQLPHSRDLIAANVADLPNLSQTDVGQSLYGSASYNLPLSASEKTTTTNRGDVVCLSDDE